MTSSKMSCVRNSTSTITLTFGDAGENHPGMEVVGKVGERGSGFTPEDLFVMMEYYAALGYEVEMDMLDPPNKFVESAAILIIRNFIPKDVQEAMFEDLTVSVKWDDKYWDGRRVKVLHSRARKNLVFADGFSQEPDYEKKKGRIVDIRNVRGFASLCESIKVGINEACDFDKASGLVCEGNFYDSRKSGIGWHGDRERRKVVAVRLGRSMKICWQWFHACKPVGTKYEYMINSGDIYIMSEKAVGADWLYSASYTIRHAAGCSKYTDLPSGA
jgi:hypothetical protein